MWDVNKVALLLELNQISKHYDTPGEQKVTVLKDIELKIGEGEFVSEKPAPRLAGTLVGEKNSDQIHHYGHAWN